MFEAVMDWTDALGAAGTTVTEYVLPGAKVCATPNKATAITANAANFIALVREMAGSFSRRSDASVTGTRRSRRTAPIAPQRCAAMHQGQNRCSTKTCNATNHSAAPATSTAHG